MYTVQVDGRYVTHTDGNGVPGFTATGLRARFTMRELGDLLYRYAGQWEGREVLIDCI